MGLEHLVQVFDTVKMIAQLGLSNLDDKCWWVEFFIAKSHELGCQAWSLQRPG